MAMAHLAVSWRFRNLNKLFPLSIDLFRAEVTVCEQKHGGMLPRVLWLNFPKWSRRQEGEENLLEERVIVYRNHIALVAKCLQTVVYRWVSMHTCMFQLQQFIQPISQSVGK